MSGLLRGTALGFTAITVVLWGDVVTAEGLPGPSLVAGNGTGTRWILFAMLVGVVLTGVGTIQALLRGKPEREAAQPYRIPSTVYRIALCFFVVSSLIFVGAKVARQLDPEGFFADGPNFGAGAVLLLAILGLLAGAILAVIASYGWVTQSRRARAKIS